MERLICLGIGYIFGLFQTSYIIGKMHHIDIRQHGSGNAGTTNALRTLGKKAGAYTLLGDCLKCVLAIVLVSFVFKGNERLPLLELYAAAGVILGHNFPCYLGFRGGKGIAASVGMVLAFDWKIFCICCIVFLTVFFITHYVSLCSVSSYIVAMIALIVFGQMGCYPVDTAGLREMYLVMAFLTVLALFRHRANIKRLLTGTESKIFLKSSSKKGQV